MKTGQTKNKINLILVICFLFISIINVNAKECTDSVPSPSMPQVAPTYSTRVFNLNTASTQCKGSNTEVWFTNYKGWNGASDDSVIYINLYEDDPPKYEPDELVKSYQMLFLSDGYFYKVLIENHNLGNIDSNGDKQCEFYLSMYSSGFRNYTTPKEIFTFNICMK